MDDPNHSRLVDLEIRYTYLERVVRELDQVIIELRGQIARLEREVVDVTGAVRNAPGSSPANEKPPHY
jgi:uncharacterized coiled-coil protein SlyX